MCTQPLRCWWQALRRCPQAFELFCWNTHGQVKAYSRSNSSPSPLFSTAPWLTHTEFVVFVRVLLLSPPVLSWDQRKALASPQPAAPDDSTQTNTLLAAHALITLHDNGPLKVNTAALALPSKPFLTPPPPPPCLPSSLQMPPGSADDLQARCSRSTPTAAIVFASTAAAEVLCATAKFATGQTQQQQLAKAVSVECSRSSATVCSPCVLAPPCDRP